MKSFDDIVEELFGWSDYRKGVPDTHKEYAIRSTDYHTSLGYKIPPPPNHPSVTDKHEYKIKSKDTPKKGIVVQGGFSSSDFCIQGKYNYSEAILKPFYGADVNEPIVKICKRILDKPARFKTLKESLYIERDGSYDLSIEKIIILDKDT